MVEGLTKPRKSGLEGLGLVLHFSSYSEPYVFMMG
jgi:hypothetical protein